VLDELARTSSQVVPEGAALQIIERLALQAQLSRAQGGQPQPAAPQAGP